MNPKILIAIGDLLGCGYYRCMMPYKALSALGYDVTLTNVLNEQMLLQYDVLVLQRQHGEGILNLVRWFKQAVPNGKVIYEFDDNLHSLPHNNPNRAVYYNGSQATKNMEAMLRLADMLTVSTDSLKKEYEKFCKNIHVCHNSLDPVVVPDILNYTPEIENSTSSKFRLGWAGSGTHHDDFMPIVKSLSEAMVERPNIQFVCIGANMSGLFPRELRKRFEYFGDTFPRDINGGATNYDKSGKNPTVEYYKLLKRANLDAAIAPIAPFLFNSCKSYIKIMEYGLAGIPFIASNFGPYKEYSSVKNVHVDKKAGVSIYYTRRAEPLGLLADDAKQWKKAIIQMHDDVELRNKLKKTNMENVLSNHLITNNLNEWVEAYKSIGMNPGPNPGKYEETIDKHQQVA